jgi:hypothetical protein
MSEHPAKENEARELSEDELAQLVQFFQMLDDWDRQSVSPVPEPPDRLITNSLCAREVGMAPFQI